MERSGVVAVAGTAGRWRTWLGLLLIPLGLLGHLLAARAIGGTEVAFKDHIFGFFLILVVSGAIIAALGRRFWKGRPDITLFTIGVVQALFGAVIYLLRFHIA